MGLKSLFAVFLVLLPALTQTGSDKTTDTGQMTGSEEKTGIGDMSDSKKTTISKLESTKPTDGLENAGETTDDGLKNAGETTDNNENSEVMTDSEEIGGETTDSDQKSGETTDNKEKSSETTDRYDMSDETTDSKENSSETTDSNDKSGETTDSKEGSGETKDSGDKSGEKAESKERSGGTTHSKGKKDETKDVNDKSGETTDNKERSVETTDSDRKSNNSSETISGITDRNRRSIEIRNRSKTCSETTDNEQNNGDTTSKEISKEKPETPKADYDIIHEAYFDGESESKGKKQMTLNVDGETYVTGNLRLKDSEEKQTTLKGLVDGETDVTGDHRFTKCEEEQTTLNEADYDIIHEAYHDGESGSKDKKQTTLKGRLPATKIDSNSEDKNKNKDGDRNRSGAPDTQNTKDDYDVFHEAYFDGDTNNEDVKQKLPVKQMTQKDPEYDIEHEMYDDGENNKIGKPRVANKTEKPSVARIPEKSHVESKSETSVLENISEEPSMANNVEDPSVANKIEKPSMEDKIEKPSMEDKFEDPSMADKIEKPSTADKVKSSRVANKIERPTVANASNFVNKFPSKYSGGKWFNTLWKYEIIMSENITDQKLIDMFLENESMENNEIFAERHKIFRRALPSLLPGRPGKPVITKHNNNLHIAWLPPFDEDESDIESYILEGKVHHGDWEVLHETGDPRTECVISKSKTTKHWKIRVVAVNEYGKGKPSHSVSLKDSEEDPLDYEGIDKIKPNNYLRKFNEGIQHGMNQSRHSSERFNKGNHKGYRKTDQFGQSSERFSNRDNKIYENIDQTRQSSERFGNILEDFSDGNKQDFERIDTPRHSEGKFGEDNKKKFDDESKNEKPQFLQWNEEGESNLYEDSDYKENHIKNNLRKNISFYDYAYSDDDLNSDMRDQIQPGSETLVHKNLDFSEEFDSGKIPDEGKNNLKETQIKIPKSIGQGDRFSEKMQLNKGQVGGRIYLKSLNSDKVDEFDNRDLSGQSDDIKFDNDGRSVDGDFDYVGQGQENINEMSNDIGQHEKKVDGNFDSSSQNSDYSDENANNLFKYGKVVNEEFDNMGPREENVNSVVDNIGQRGEHVDKIIDNMVPREEDVNKIVDDMFSREEYANEIVDNLGPRKEDVDDNVDGTSQNNDYIEKNPKNERSDESVDKEFGNISQEEEDVDENSSSYFQNLNFGNDDNNVIHFGRKRNIRSNAGGHGMDVDCWSSSGKTDKEECMENAGRKAIHKCVNLVGNLPEFKSTDPIKHVLGSIGHAYESNKNITQICIQEVFDRCNYDTQFRIQMKAVNTIGVSMHIDFQEEFEMDKCNPKSVQKMLSAIENCYKDDIKHTKTSGTDTACQILNEAAYCIEDHTAYTCVIDDPKLFRDTMTKLMHSIKEFSLKQLEKDRNTKNYNKTRLCLVYLDYFRVEPCEKDFYLYVQCLANGTMHEGLFNKVLACFENAFKHCPKEFIEQLIEILAGAVGGRGGYQHELSGPSGDLHPQDSTALENYKPIDYDASCTNKLIDENIRNVKRCLIKEERKNRRRNYNMCTINLEKCQVVNMLPCRFHKYSMFENLAKHLLEMRDENCRTTDGSCRPASFKTIEPCIWLLFQAYVTLHHIHYNKQDIAKQLMKAGLCFYSKLKPCEKRNIHMILTQHAKPLNLEIPKNYNQEGAIRTSVTFPDENVLCSTRFWPLPTSEFYQKKTPQIHHYPITRQPYQQMRFPTTKRSTHYRKEAERYQDSITPPTTRRSAYVPPMKRYTAVMHASPVRFHFVNVSGFVHYDVLPRVTPQIYSRKPFGGGYTHVIKPTEIYTHGVDVPIRHHTAVAYAPHTVTRWHFPGPVKYGHRITNTVAYSRHLTPPTKPFDQDYEAPATEKEGHTPHQKEYHYHIHAPKPSYEKVEIPEKHYSIHHDVPPTSKHKFPAPPKYVRFNVTPQPSEKYRQTAPAHHIHFFLHPKPTRTVRIPPKRPLPRHDYILATTHKYRRIPNYILHHFYQRPLTTARYRIHYVPTREHSVAEAAHGTKKSKHVPKQKHYHYYIKGTKSKTTRHEKFLMPTKEIVRHVPAVPTKLSHHKGRGPKQEAKSYSQSTFKYVENPIVEHHYRTKYHPHKPHRYHYRVKGSSYTEVAHVTPGYRIHTPADRPGISEFRRGTTGMVHFHQPNIRYGTRADYPTTRTAFGPAKRRTHFERRLPTKIYTHHVYPPAFTRRHEAPPATTQKYTIPKCEKTCGWFPISSKIVDMNQLIGLTGCQCNHPFAIECQSGSPNKVLDKVTCDIHNGFHCKGNCEEYKVKLMCCEEKFVEEKPPMTFQNQPTNKYLPIEKFSREVGQCNWPTHVTCAVAKNSNPNLRVHCDVIRGVKCIFMGKPEFNGTCSFIVSLTCCQCERRYQEHVRPPGVMSHHYPPAVHRAHKTIPPATTHVFHKPPKKPESFTEHWKPTKPPRRIHVPHITHVVRGKMPVTSMHIIIRIPPIGRYPGREPAPPTSIYKQTPGPIPPYHDSQKTTTLRSRHYPIPPDQISAHHPAPPTSVHRQIPEAKQPYKQRKTYTTDRSFDVQPPMKPFTVRHFVPHTSIYKQPPGKILIYYYDHKKITTQKSRDIQPQHSRIMDHHPVPPTKVYRQPPGHSIYHYWQRKKYSTERNVYRVPPRKLVSEIHPAPPTSMYRLTPGYPHYHDMKKFTTQRHRVVQPRITIVPGYQHIPPTSKYRRPPHPVIHYHYYQKATTAQLKHVPIHHHTFRRYRHQHPTSVQKYTIPRRHYIEHHIRTTTRPEEVHIPERHYYIGMPRVTPRRFHLPQKPYHYYIHHRGHSTIVHYKVPRRGVVTRYLPNTTKRIHYEQHPTRQHIQDDKGPATQIEKHTPAWHREHVAERTTQTTKAIHVPIKPKTHRYEEVPGVTRIIHHRHPERPGYHDVVNPPIPEHEHYTVTRIPIRRTHIPDPTKIHALHPSAKIRHDFIPATLSRHIHIPPPHRRYTDAVPWRYTTQKAFHAFPRVPIATLYIKFFTAIIRHTPPHGPTWIQRRRPTPVITVPGHHIPYQVTHQRHLPATQRIRYIPTGSHYRRRKFPTTLRVRTVPMIPAVRRVHHTIAPPEAMKRTAPARRYTGYMMHTTARTYKRPPPIHHYTHYHYPPPTRIHRPPLHTRVIKGHESPGKPTRVVYTPPIGTWCDHFRKRPPKKTTITCYKVNRPKEICTDEGLRRWRSKIRNCVLDRMHRRGNCLEHKPITKECLKRLRTILIICLRIIGDTICRSDLNLLELVTEKEIVVVGRLIEEAEGKEVGGGTHSHGENPPQHPPQRPHQHPPQGPPHSGKPESDTSKCVDRGDSGKINQCYPGLYEVLVSVVVKKHGKVALELHNINSPCLSKALEHCSTGSLEDLKKKLEKIFGVCIIPVPGHACKSDSMGFKSLESPYCEQSQIHKFTHHLESCVNQTFKPDEFKELAITKKLKTINHCTNMKTLDCVFRKWETFLELISYICQVIRQTPSDQPCSNAFTISNFRECSQNLISVTSALHDIKHGIDQNVMNTIKDCYKQSLKDCSTEVSVAFLNLLEALTNTAYLSEGEESSEEMEDELPLERGKRRVTLSSIKVSTDGVKICEQTDQVESEDFDKNTPAKDICEPLRSFENDDSKSTTYVLRKSCRGFDVVTWMESLKKCVGGICDSIALEDPSSLTLERVLNVFRECLQKQGQLQCRPKVQKTFKLFLTSVLDTLRVMSVKSSAKSCHDDLAIDNIATCVNHLHLYLVVKYHASVLRNEESKSIECLRRTCNHCDFEFLKGLLATLDESINKNKDSINDAESQYTVCEPDDPEYNRMADLCQGITREGKLSKRAPNSNILKKSMDTKSLENYSDKIPDEDEQEDNDDYQPTIPNKDKQRDDVEYQPTISYKSLDTDNEAGTTNRECGANQFINYLKTIFECQRLRMDTLIHLEGTNCELNWSEKALKSLVQCVLENREAKLPCIISDQRQVQHYLNDLSIKLDANKKFEGLECPSAESCFESVPRLSKCSNGIYDILKSSENENNDINTKHTSTILNCLKSIWPDCPPSVSLLSLPSIFVPLGIKLTGIVQQTENEVCLSAKAGSKDRNLICSHGDTRASTQIIYECLERITRKIEEIMKKSHEKIPWEIMPFTVCVSTHPILECKLKDYDEFMEFMQNFLSQIQFRLKRFVELFDKPHDKELGEKCLAQFSAPKLDKCLSLMFGFMQSFHSGGAKYSDYPQQCVEEIFGICGDIQVFHVFMKKSMNISMNETGEEVCIKTQQEDYALHSCTFGNFVKSLPDITECTKEVIRMDTETKKNLLELCKNCVLKKPEEMCFYNLPDLKEVVNASLSAISKCLNTFNAKDHCGYDFALNVKDQCISHFYEYTNNIRNGTITKAIQLSREFYQCIKTTAKTCTADASKTIFNLYSRISGIEIFSRYKQSHSLSDIPG